MVKVVLIKRIGSAPEDYVRKIIKEDAEKDILKRLEKTYPSNQYSTVLLQGRTEPEIYNAYPEYKEQNFENPSPSKS